jgi:hypothetical protein
VVHLILGMDEEIVHVDNESHFSDVITKKVVHEGLERSGELQRSKSMTVGSKSLKRVINAAFQQSSGLISTLLYLHCMYIHLGEDM